MTTLSAARTRGYTNSQTNAYPISSSTTIWGGAAVGIDMTTGLARAIQPGDPSVGFAKSSVNHILGQKRDVFVTVVDCGQVVLAVSGAAQTSVGKDVYATDDDTFTLTSPGGSFIGVAKQFVSAGKLLVEISPPFNMNVVRRSSDGLSLVSGDGTWPLPILPSGDTTGVRDVATIQAVIDAMPSTGGVLRFAAGVFYLASEIAVAKTMKIEGAGGGIGGDAGTDPSIAATTINCISQTANGFNVSASGCTFRDFALVNTYAGTPTAGAGIKNTSNTTTTIDAITVLGFYNLLDLAGCYYSVTNCRLYDGVNYYVYHHSLTSPYDDHGDFVVSNCVLSGWKKSYVAVAQLRWEGGGGIRVVGNKFNGATQPGNVSAGSSAYCIQCLVKDAITTGSLVISGNSISSKVGTTANVYIGALGPTYNGAFTSVSIVGNEIAVGVLGIVVEGNASYNDKVKGVHIAENIFSFMSSSAVKIRYVRRCHIGQNSHNGATGTDPIIDIPDLTADCQSLSIDKQFIDEAATSRDIIRDNRSIGNTAGALSNGVVYDYTQGLDISTVSTWKQVFKIEVTNQAAGKFTLDIDGRSTDASNTSPNRKGVTWKQERSFDVNGSGSVTLATIGTDYSGGAAAAFINTRFTLTTNYIAVEVQSVDATNCVLWGMARLRVTGKLQRFHIGT